jgi:hypothetical protein
LILKKSKNSVPISETSHALACMRSSRQRESERQAELLFQSLLHQAFERDS